jgi:hypothetical protein
MSVDLAATTIVPAIVGQAAKAATMSAGGMVVGKFGGIALEIGGGTAAGSEVPIIGNAVGLFVGVVVAVLAQDFGEAVENEMLRRDLNRYIDDLKVALVGDGSMQSELTKNMDAYVRKNDQAQAEIVEEPIFGSRKDQQP